VYGDGRRLDAKYLLWAGDPCDPDMDEPPTGGVCSTALVSASFLTNGMANPTMDGPAVTVTRVLIPTATLIPEPYPSIDP
jgi:hypothetical protein